MYHGLFSFSNCPPRIHQVIFLVVSTFDKRGTLSGRQNHNHHKRTAISFKQLWRFKKISSVNSQSNVCGSKWAVQHENSLEYDSKPSTKMHRQKNCHWSVHVLAKTSLSIVSCIKRSCIKRENYFTFTVREDFPGWYISVVVYLDINNLACPPLDPARRGYLMCSREAVPRLWRGARRATNRPGTKCYLKCPPGYQLHGEYELTCQGDGTWDGPKHGECVSA